MNDSAKFFLGYPAEFKNICLIYPPKVKDILTVKNYAVYERLLTYSQEDIEDEYTEKKLDMSSMLTPFEYILNGAYNSLDFRNLLSKAFMFFVHEPIIILPEDKQISIGDLKEAKSVTNLRMLTEEDYFDFQNMVREAVGKKPVEKPDPDEHPRIKAMKAKARYRDRIKAKKNMGLNLKSMLASICCMDLSLNPLNIGELSYAAVPVLFATYQEKEKYQLDIDSLLAGADSKKVKPKYWIRNLDD